MADTKIEWATKVWNPTRGCSRVSPGCDRCYAMHEARRHDHPGGSYEGLTKINTGRTSHPGVDWKGIVRLVPEQLHVPLRWRKPQRIFVNSMSDLFHESLSFEDIAKVIDLTQWGFWLSCRKKGDCNCECDHDPETYAPDPSDRPDPKCRCWSEATEHTYQILTKRPARMLEFFTWLGEPSKKYPDHSNAEIHTPTYHASMVDGDGARNLWLGVSVEDRARLHRIDELRAVPLGPSGVRFVSFEPLLEDLGALDLTGIRWAIFGGESGNSGARPCDPNWIRSGVRQCREQRVAPFVKQMGRWLLGDPTGITESARLGFRTNHFLLSDGRGWVPPLLPSRWHRPESAIGFSLYDSKGGDPEEWPSDLRVREFPS